MSSEWSCIYSYRRKQQYKLQWQDCLHVLRYLCRTFCPVAGRIFFEYKLKRCETENCCQSTVGYLKSLPSIPSHLKLIFKTPSDYTYLSSMKAKMTIVFILVSTNLFCQGINN